MLPVYIKPACLKCHGEPEGEKDIAGGIKEGYKEGEAAGCYQRNDTIFTDKPCSDKIDYCFTGFQILFLIFRYYSVDFKPSFRVILEVFNYYFHIFFQQKPGLPV